jgi:hypothetical protein
MTNKDKLLTRAILARLLIRHFTHRVDELTSLEAEELLLEAYPGADGKELLACILVCEDCCDFIVANSKALAGELSTLTDDEIRELFNDDAVTKWIVSGIVKAREKPLMVDGCLSPDLVQVVRETLNAVRRYH